MDFKDVLQRRYSCRASEAWTRRYDGKNGAEVDASIVASYRVGSFDPSSLSGLLPGSEGYDLVAMINIGYIPLRTASPPRCMASGSRWRNS